MDSIIDKNVRNRYCIITKCKKDLLYDRFDKDYSNEIKLELKRNKIKIEDKRYCGSVFIMDL